MLSPRHPSKQRSDGSFVKSFAVAKKKENWTGCGIAFFIERRHYELMVFPVTQSFNASVLSPESLRKHLGKRPTSVRLLAERGRGFSMAFNSVRSHPDQFTCSVLNSVSSPPRSVAKENIWAKRPTVRLLPRKETA
jgi:hypothetical protein